MAAMSKRKGKRFNVSIPGVNISISLQPTRKGVTIVRPRVSRVTVERENPRRRTSRKGRRNPLPALTIPGRPGLIAPQMATRTFRP